MTINNCVLHVSSGLSFSCEIQYAEGAYSSRQNVAGPSLTAEALFGSCTKYLICSDTTDKDKSIVHFFIKHPYEKLFKDGLTQEVDELIYTDGSSRNSRTILNEATLPNSTGL